MKKKLLVIAMIFVMGMCFVFNYSNSSNHLASNDGEHEWNGVVEPI